MLVALATESFGEFAERKWWLFSVFILECTMQRVVCGQTTGMRFVASIVCLPAITVEMIDEADSHSEKTIRVK
jgi:hypothetical protein